MKVENAEKVLQNLVHIGAVTEEQIRAAEGFTPDEEQAAKVLHTLFCFKSHGALEGECGYYEGDIETVQPWIYNLRNMCSVTELQPAPLVELCAGVAKLLEEKGTAYQLIATAILTVTEEFTLEEFLADAEGEDAGESEETGSQESVSPGPQTPPPLQEAEKRDVPSTPGPESPDQAGPRPTTSDG